ncbi:hypothetical protein GE115_10520 [Agromyces sp. CFH 90414]|uniref:Uncharacterized protein n=1 Tax=Agromyces agglutinans TaxID=2662258 RepID=A0A6I2FCT4_9MICO|nr:hypothetical protein [Agromyces agglutinans]MRG60296.1 hypothetical protein [Agromyces agglutinans]
MNSSPIESTARPDRSAAPAARRRGLGLPFLALVGLALLTVPRVVLHDLDLLHEGTFVNLLFVVVPPAVWIAVVLWRRVPMPFVTLLVIGAISGVFLALVHQVLWGVAFGDRPPMLGGNLADLDPTVQSLIMRTFASISSLFTGVVVGVVVGLVGWGLSAALGRRPQR